MYDIKHQIEHVLGLLITAILIAMICLAEAPVVPAVFLRSGCSAGAPMTRFMT